MGNQEKKVIDVSGKKVKIIKNLIKNHSNAFIYLDPPYYPISTRKDGKISPYKLYNATDYLPSDFLKLKERCDDLTHNGIPFVLSNSDCEFIRFLFRDYNLVEVRETQSVKTSKGKGSRPTTGGLLITNFRDKKYLMKLVKETIK